MQVSRNVFTLAMQQRKRFQLYSTESAPKERTIKIDQWDINYLTVGKGAHHVLCMPGTLGSIWTDFKQQIEQFDRNKFSLVVWDPPGYGKSRPPPRNFKIDLYESDAIYAYELMKALQITKYSILGWSGGAISGMTLAARYPEVMEKLVVWGGPSCILPHEKDIYLSEQTKNLDSWSDQMKQPLLAVYGKELLAAYWLQWVDIMSEIYFQKQGNFCLELLGLIKCPTFVLHGEKDPMVDVVHARYLVRHIPNARLYVYPEGKHNIHLNYGDDFNKRVQEFLQEP